MNELIEKQVVLDKKMEFLNPHVERESYEATIHDRAYADGWNACNQEWINAIKNILPVYPQLNIKQDLTPCSKGLPDDGVYIVYAPNYTGGSSSAKECHNGIMFSHIKNGKWSIEHGYHKRPGCVKSWMPLPEPYKEDKEC